MKKLTLTAILIALLTAAFSQVNVSGCIKDFSTRQPLPGAFILVPGTQEQTVSDYMGNFRLNNLRTAGPLLITSFVGYKTDTTRLEPGKTEVTIWLKESPVMAEEVIIESTRAGMKMPMSYQDIGHNELNRSNFGQDLPMLIANGISTVATSDAGNGIGYTAFRIRGTDMTRINVTINGIPLNDPESHNVFWVDLPDIATSTDNIQIQRGVGTSTNGAAAFGASMNLLLSKISSAPYAEFSTSAGSFNSIKLNAGFGTGLLNRHWSLEGRISRLHSDGFVDRATSDLFSYFLSTSYSDAKNVLKFNIISGSEKTYQAWDGIPGSILDSNRRYNGIGAYYDAAGHLRYYDNETDNYRQDHYQLLYTRQLSGRLYLNAGLHYTMGKGYYEQYKDDEYLEDYGMEALRINSGYFMHGQDTILVPDSVISISDLVRRKWLDNDFAGITYSLNWNKGRFRSSLGGSWNTYTGRHFGRVIWTEYGTMPSPDFEWYRSKAVKNDFNIYSKTNFELNGKVNLFADLQIRRINYTISGIDDDLRDISQEHRFLFFNPKLGIFFTPNSADDFYASFGVAGREPNRDNYVDADPAKPLPVAEKLFDLEVGHHHHRNRISFSENIYYMYYRDQLALTGAINDVGNAVMENIPESFRLGIELSAKAMLTSQLSWKPSVTLSRNKIIRYTEYVDDWDTWTQLAIVRKMTDLAFSPSITANSEINWTPARDFSISFITKYVGRQYIDNTQDNDRSLDPYLLNDINLVYTLNPRFCKEIAFSARVNNIFNHEYESNAWVYRYWENGEFKKYDGFFPQAGINFMAGMNLKF